MKKYLAVFILSFIFVFLPASYAASFSRVSKKCTFNLQLNDGKVYPFSNIRDFISNQIRPAIKATSNFTVDIIRQCHGKVARLPIEMSPKNLYILSINGEQLSKEVTSYTNQNLPLSQGEFATIYNKALKFSSLSETAQQNVVKTLAFLLAESARFSTISNAVNMVFNNGCVYQWENFRHILRRWSVLSRFAIQQGIVPDDVYYGSSSLFVPISDPMVYSYNHLTTAGYRIQYYDTWVSNDPIWVQTSDCVGTCCLANFN